MFEHIQYFKIESMFKTKECKKRCTLIYFIYTNKKRKCCKFHLKLVKLKKVNFISLTNELRKLLTIFYSLTEFLKT